MSKFSVLHAPSSVGGNPQILSRAMQRLGIDSRSMVVSQTYLSYPADIILHRPNQSHVMRELKRLWSIFFLLPRFDVIHFNAGTTIASAYAIEFRYSSGLRGVVRLIYSAYLRALQSIELIYLQLLGKTVFITFQGDDARRGDYSLENFEFSIASQVEVGYYCRVSDIFKRLNIVRLCTMACGVFALNPDLLHVLPKGSKFVPYSNIFLDEWVPHYTQDDSGPLRIAHAPTHRRVKGTELILDALQQLKAQGLVCELLLVEGLSNADAKKVYESADVLVDQLFAGWYGGLAVELMALGKPVMVYIRGADLQFIPEVMKAELPFLQITPNTVYESLQMLLQMPRSELVALGKRSRAFVERWHDPIQIAEATIADYRRSIGGRKEDHI